MRRIILQKTRACIIMCCVAASANPSCVRLPRRGVTAVAQVTPAALPSADKPKVSINHGSREELERLPGIGPAFAARIIEYRERYGPFRRIEHLLMGSEEP